ncbi:hypothetical protein JL100_027495 [Skermanella mucosa]|uniref:hypothetical protein n=1 Tax=Skermanella mucosa TaxID=1789672 RepID=UPI00192A852E|nr:hypothetical protein [Skermanella mucosa]UEM20778.1 hypothetical protein JL100_027495 [Skermanella mucosa]
MKEFIDYLIEVAEWSDGHLAVPTAVYDEEPEILDNSMLHAHVGGMAEHLARLVGGNTPPWCEKPCYFLQGTYFLYGERSRLFLLESTPEAFRRRGLFCGPVLQKLVTALKISAPNAHIP